MKSRILRAAARVLFLAAAAACLAALILLPFPLAGPTLRTLGNLPAARAATPTASPRRAPLPDGALPAVEEPPVKVTPIVYGPPGDIFAFMYHDLTTDRSQTSPWRTTVESMRSDLEEILEMGYLPLSLEAYLRGETVAGQDYFIVTFDDGYTTNLTMAEPLLRELGIPATLFVITGSTELPEHMTWDELRAMRDGGVFTIYSHTDSHIDAEGTADEVFLADERTAQRKLTAELGAPAYKVLSYPDGAYTYSTMRALAAEGYALFAIQNRPWWYAEGNAQGIRILVRMNVAYEADMPYLVAFNRSRNGFGTVEAKLAAERRAAEAARLAAEQAVRDARAAWLAHADAEDAGDAGDALEGPF